MKILSRVSSFISIVRLKEFFKVNFEETLFFLFYEKSIPFFVKLYDKNLTNEKYLIIIFIRARILFFRVYK